MASRLENPVPDPLEGVFQNVLLPLKVDAFVFNKAVCDAGGKEADSQKKAKIANIAQPNYSFLRLDQQYLQSDITNDVDLHNAFPAEKNSRFTDLGTGEPRVKRQGVYIHWTMPRVYRSGRPGKENKDDKAQQAPQYPEVPTRWLVVRKIDDMNSVQPAEARDSGKVKPVTGWVLESDRMWDIDELGIDKDLQVDVSPFIKTATDSIDLKGQAEVFIGAKEKAELWKETWVNPKPGMPLDKEQSKKRVNLSLLSSSNQLFPDYQPHCSNVFSIVDNFEYAKDQYLTAASASYYVLGWHSKTQTDLFQPEDPTQELLDQTRRELLSALNMEIKGTVKKKTKEPKVTGGGSDKPIEIPDAINNWLKSKVPTFTLCHGAMYSVKWDVNKAPENIPADHFAELINGTLPLSVGTTPMDALMAYAGAHQGDGTTVGEVERILKKMEEALLATDDGVESQAKASDLLYNWNYLRLDGGQLFHFSGSESGGKPTIPDDKRDNLAALNRHQRFADSIARRLQRLQWRMFSEWWKFVTMYKPKDDQIENAATEVTKIREAMKDLKDELTTVEGQIKEIRDKDTQKLFLAGTLPAFQQQRDPTLLVGGVKSGWEPDYLDPLSIRLDLQLGDPKRRPALQRDGWEDILKAVKEIPKDLQESATALLQEFVRLESVRDDKESDKVLDQAPLFHDTVGSPAPTPPGPSSKAPEQPRWRDFWHDTQPWFPLFLEWEVEYTHIDRKHWDLYENQPYDAAKARMHYGIKEGVDVEEEHKDVRKRDSRRLSGRVLILPQPTFSLEAKIKQLFESTPVEKLNDLAPVEDRETINRDLHLLEFLSAPLSGFNSHLVTLEQGNHVKPSIKKPSGELTFLAEAERKAIGLGKDEMASIGVETDVTPYGSSKRSNGRGYPAFKNVAHGQFKFVRLNIIDKFGQAIHAVDPRITRTPQKVWPCISEWYQPQAKTDGKTPNVIETSQTLKDKPKCEYVQVPPQVNQPTRIRSTFVMPHEISVTDPETGNTEKKPSWRAANEWDNPIWGWVVINYANSGIQFFLKDGTFYREVRLSGETGATASPEWLPFKKPDDPEKLKDEVKQLTLLIESLLDKDYLAHFYVMLKTASAVQDPMPSAYADYTNALIGRPLALVNMGWSLELATPEWESQMINDVKEYKRLLKISDSDKNIYDFPIKLGDTERGYDGLVGYFNAKPRSSLSKGDSLDLRNFYSHYASGTVAQPTDVSIFKSEDHNIVQITTSNFPVLNASYVDPLTAKTSDDYDKQLDECLIVFGALVNPFNAVHGYSGILPIKELRLPNWTWEASMGSMTAFFHAGPVLVADDVPDFDVRRQLRSGVPVKAVEKPEGESGVRLAATSMNQWVWLQPYDVQKPKGDADSNGDEEEVEVYMPLAVDAPDLKARLGEGPYLALEGYLQMAPAAKEEQGKTGL
ncbi:hypothetical protein B0T21DRAFT_369068 [Apiosordaria backusii]|uniref:Uncharacterized protein n=1 Tax=Apiosordaria backusii TaxID=314023 RepID=A0AA40BDV8_9PEZI|nr:hypothetical protein B0T21DRAFT_369068 [Apiosordaria backusii]